MSIKTLATTVLGCLLLIVLVVCVVHYAGRKPEQKVPLDVQLRGFERVGIKLGEGVTTQDVLSIWPKQSLESDPYNSLYSVFGFFQQAWPNAPLCNQIWSFDTKSVIERQDYDWLLKNIGRISDEELQFGYISVTPDGDEKDPVAIVAFDLNGKRFSLDIHLRKDWNSAAFLWQLNQLAEEQGLKGRLVWNRSWGPQWTLGWHTPEQIRGLRELGVDIEEVSSGISPRPRPKRQTR